MTTLTSHHAMDTAATKQIVRAGVLGGLVGGVTIFFYAVPLALIVKQRLG